MFNQLHTNQKIQLLLGFLIGIVFGFLLDKGGATTYAILMQQLLLQNFRVLKLIFTAIVTGMIGVHILVKYNLADLHLKPFRWKNIVIGGLLFGVGFALLGYCPGTTTAALGTGSLHALFGVVGILIGAGLFASLYPTITKLFNEQDSEELTIPQLLNLDKWTIILLLSSILIGLMYFLEMYSF